MNYIDYLKEQLDICKADLDFDINITVASERSFVMPDNPDDLLFVVKELSGTYVFGDENSPSVKSVPVQIIGYSELNTFMMLKQIMDLFTQRHQNESLTLDNNLIKQTYGTVVALRPITDSETGFRASFYTFGQYIKCTGLSDIKDLTVMCYSSPNVKVKYISASLSYTALLNTTKISGNPISNSDVQEAGIVLNITMMSGNDDFVKDINRIMSGKISNNFAFAFSYRYGWESNQTPKHTIYMKLTNATLSTNRTDAPGLELVFTA